MFGTSTLNVVLLVTADSGDVDDPPTAAAGTALTERLAAEEHVVDVASYWSLGSAPPLRSIGGKRALVLATIEGGEDAVDERIAELAPDYAGEVDGLTVGVGGFAEVFRQVGTTIAEDPPNAALNLVRASWR